MTHTSLLALVALGLTTLSGQAGDYGKAPIIDDKNPFVTLSLDTRIRYEYGEFENLDASNAATIRNRIGLLTKEINGFKAFVEYEGTIAADPNDYWDLSTEANTLGQTPIADPESHELNQAWLQFTTPDQSFTVKGGRQRIILDNARFVGNVGWRQNEQTYDAVGFDWKPTPDLTFSYDYIWSVERIFGSDQNDGLRPLQDDFDSSSHLINVAYTGLPFGKLVGYVYSLDLENIAGTRFSSNTFGFNLSGEIGSSGGGKAPISSGLMYYVEYAYQTDAYDGPVDYSANYVHANLSKKFGPVTATVGYEMLGDGGGNGAGFDAFQTPLATGHKFNGFADLFLVTPDGGLSDVYVSLATKVAGMKLVGTYHYFADDGFDVEYGQEVDVVLVKKLTDNVTALAKGAFYKDHSFNQDVTRASIQLDIKY